MNENGTFGETEKRPGTPFKGLPTPTVRTSDIPENAFRPSPDKIAQLPGIELANHHCAPWSKLRAGWNAVSAKRLGSDADLSKIAAEISKLWLMCGGIDEDTAARHVDDMGKNAMKRDTGDNLAQAICWFPHNLVTGPKEDTRVDDPGDEDFDCFCHIPAQALRCQWVEKAYDTFKVQLDAAHLGILKEAFQALSKEKLTSPTAFDVHYWVLATYPHGYNPKDGKYHQEWGGKPMWQKRSLDGAHLPYIQGTVFSGKGGDMFEKRQAGRK